MNKPQVPEIISNQYVTGEYGARCPSWHKEDSEWKAGQLMQSIPPDFWDQVGGDPVRLVDIGCGAGAVLGHVCRSLSSMGKKVRGIGIDIADEARTHARQDWPELTFRQQSIHELDEPFDIGLLMDVVEHVENPWQLIRDAKKRCRYLIFHIPLDDNLLTEIANLYAYKAESMGHIQFYTRRKALWLLESSGLEVLSHRFTLAFRVESSLALSFRHKLLSYPRRFLALVNPAACARWLGGLSLMVVTRAR